MFLRPNIIRFIPMAVVAIGWTANAVLAYIRGHKKLAETKKWRKPVNCKHLVPPLKAVPRRHCCNMSAGYEGDCFIFLNKKDYCRFREEM